MTVRMRGFRGGRGDQIKERGSGEKEAQDQRKGGGSGRKRRGQRKGGGSGEEEARNQRKRGQTGTPTLLNILVPNVPFCRT